MGSENSVNNYNNHETCDRPLDGNNTTSDATTYFRNLSLAFFVGEPSEMITQHARLRERCLKVDNPEVHYIEGVLKYFYQKEKGDGLYHLRQASLLNNTNGTYLYGILMLALGHYKKGKKYLDKLQWKESPRTSDQCWERVKKSLRSIPQIMERSYYMNMVNFQIRSNCNKYDDMFEVCEECYHFKRLNQFIEFAMKNDD